MLLLFVYQVVTIKSFCEGICEELKNNKDEIISFNIHVYDLVSHYDIKGAVMLCIFGVTVAYPTTSILICKLLFIVNVNSLYLKYEVSIVKCVGQAVT